MASWENLHSADDDSLVPIFREGHSVFYYKEEVYIFAGASTMTNPELEEDEVEEGSDCNTLYKFNTRTKEWVGVTTQGETPSPRSGFASVIVENIFYIFGGLDSLEGWKNDMYALDLETATWEKLKIKGAIPSPRDKAGCSLIDKNTIILFGGFGPATELLPPQSGEEDIEETATFTWFNSTFTFDIRTSQWVELTTTGDIPTPRAAMGSCILKNGDDATHLYIVGGRDNQGKRTNSVFSLQLDTLTWKQHACSGVEITPRSFHAIRRVTNNSIMIFGGLDNDTNLLNDLHILNTDTHEWITPQLKDNVNISARSYFGISQEIYEGGVIFYVQGGSAEYEAGASVATHGDVWRLSFLS